MNSTADTLMLNAKGFAMSAETLLLTRDSRHDLTILHLVCVSLELSFKAFIRFNGGTEREIRKISHHLDAAYARAIELGMTNPDGNLAIAVESLSPIYSADYTRYFPNIEGFQTLTPQSLVDVARGVALAVEDDVWPDAAKARPGEPERA